MALNIERKTQFSRILIELINIYLIKYRRKFIFRHEIDIFFEQDSINSMQIILNTKKKKKKKNDLFDTWRLFYVLEFRVIRLIAADRLFSIVSSLSFFSFYRRRVLTIVSFYSRGKGMIRQGLPAGTKVTAEVQET